MSHWCKGGCGGVCTGAKKRRPEGHHDITAALCPILTSLKQAVRTHGACSGHLPLPFPTTTACLQTRWLRPRRDAKQQHLTQRPDMIGQARCHGWRLRPPPLGRAAAVGGQGLWQRLAYAGMWEAKVVVRVIQSQLLAYAVLALAERGDTTSHRRHMLTDSQVDAFNEGRVDVPAVRGQHLLNSRQRAEEHPVAHPHQAPPAYRLDHLRIEQTRQGHPAGLGSCPCGLTACGLYPLPVVRQQRRRVLLEAVRQEQRDTA